MKKIKITEKQAELIGLKKLKEEDQPSGAPDTGMKSVGGALGPKPVRVVIEGTTVAKMKELIIKTVMRQDPSAKLEFFEMTGKIVGTVSETKMASITRDIKSIDPSIKFEKKAISRSLKEGKTAVRITRKQYNKLIAAGVINESIEVTGGLDRVDKAFDKTSVGKLKEEGGDEIKKETLELIKYLYRKSEELSPFWEKHGLSYEDIEGALKTKNLIVSHNGKCELSKSIGSPQQAVQAVEDELRTMVGGGESAEKTSPEIETEEAGDYPAGAAQDKEAPFNQNDIQTKPVAPKIQFKVIAMNREIAILKGPDNALYVFWYYDIDKKDLFNYAKVDKTVIGKDGEGQADYEFGDVEITPDVVERYLNDNLSTIAKGNGSADYERGAVFVKIDAPLKQELISLYDKNKDIVKALSVVQEMTGAASSGAFTAPMGMVSKEMPIKNDELDVPVVKETTAGTASVGPYDANALPRIKRNGTFTKPKKTKAEEKTQWAGGSFVKMNDCTKYNNKPAGSGCSQGASDHVVTTTKTKGNVNAPSLGEGQNVKGKQ